MIKRKLKQVIGPKLLGALDYYRFPESRRSWGGPLNGQQRRQEIVVELFDRLGINAVVETGTFRGTTTEYFSQLCSGPVFTIEADDRLFGYSSVRLLFRRNVTLSHGDSRHILKSLAVEPRLSGKQILFYLDAHWGEDLPLAEELDLVFTNWPMSVVLIDDFQVPDDSGYGYDDYGPNAALTLDYTKPVMDKHRLQALFPAASSAQETGARRGCVIFVADPGLCEEVTHLQALRSIERPLLSMDTLLQGQE